MTRPPDQQVWAPSDAFRSVAIPRLAGWSNCSRMCNGTRCKLDGDRLWSSLLKWAGCSVACCVCLGCRKSTTPDLVTAGNSFGLMTAGIDAAVVRFFGEPLMQRVQHRIMDEFFGEQPVGTAFVLSTGDAQKHYFFWTNRPVWCHTEIVEPLVAIGPRSLFADSSVGVSKSARTKPIARGVNCWHIVTYDEPRRDRARKQTQFSVRGATESGHPRFPGARKRLAPSALNTDLLAGSG